MVDHLSGAGARDPIGAMIEGGGRSSLNGRPSFYPLVSDVREALGRLVEARRK